MEGKVHRQFVLVKVPENKIIALGCLKSQIKYSSQAGITKDARLNFVDMSVYCNAGCDPMEASVGEAVHFTQNAYNANAWSIKPYRRVNYFKFSSF